MAFHEKVSLHGAVGLCLGEAVCRKLINWEDHTTLILYESNSRKQKRPGDSLMLRSHKPPWQMCPGPCWLHPEPLARVCVVCCCFMHIFISLEHSADPGKLTPDGSTWLFESMLCTLHESKNTLIQKKDFTLASESLFSNSLAFCPNLKQQCTDHTAKSLLILVLVLHHPPLTCKRWVIRFLDTPCH